MHTYIFRYSSLMRPAGSSYGLDGPIIMILLQTGLKNFSYQTTSPNHQAINRKHNGAQVVSHLKIPKINLPAIRIAIFGCCFFFRKKPPEYVRTFVFEVNIYIK